MPAVDNDNNGNIVFDEVQIARGLRPVTQHGSVVITPETISLLGTDRQPIDSAPISAVTASMARFSRGQAVAVTINATRYNLSPGWGARPAFVLPGDAKDVKTAAARLLHLINNGGRA